MSLNLDKSLFKHAPRTLHAVSQCIYSPETQHPTSFCTQHCHPYTAYRPVPIKIAHFHHFSAAVNAVGVSKYIPLFEIAGTISKNPNENIVPVTPHHHTSSPTRQTTNSFHNPKQYPPPLIIPEPFPHLRLLTPTLSYLSTLHHGLYRGAPDPPIHGVPFLSAPALPRRRVSNPRTKHSNLLSVSDRLGRRGSGPPVQGAHSSESDPPTQGGTSSPLRLEADVSSVSDIDDGSSSTPPVQQEEHRCPHPRCNKTYKTMRDAVKHVNSTHKDQFRLPNGFARCPSPRCRQVFTRGGLSIHQRKKHPHLPLTPRNSDDEAQEDVPQPPQPIRENDPSNLPSIETLHQFFTRETTWLSPKWKPLLQQLHLLLLQRTRATITSTSPNHSFSAYLLLPGFMETVRIANRLPGAKQLKIDSPITYLRAFVARSSLQSKLKKSLSAL